MSSSLALTVLNVAASLFDTVISANPATYVGSADALKNARIAAEDFAKAVFDRIEFIRSN
ncbi:plasmid partition protein A [Escherichia coli]|nr:plasmid partition protein A [Escherichia coli]